MAITATYAGFNTGYNQREVRILAKGASSLTLKVGELCTYTPSTKTIAKNTTGSASVGNVIIAQSDMTVGKGHVPVEKRDYRYDDSVSITTSEKPIMVFFVDNVADVIITRKDETT